jgi:hypothetical protein
VCWYLFTPEEQSTAKRCPRPNCNAERPPGVTQQSYFLSVDIAKELESKISVTGAANKCTYIHTRKKINNTHLEDIMDGKRFRDLQKKGWFAKTTDDYGIVVGLDGVSLFKRSHVQVWPMWGIICNFSPAERY